MVRRQIVDLLGNPYVLHFNVFLCAAAQSPSVQEGNPVCQYRRGTFQNIDLVVFTSVPF